MILATNVMHFGRILRRAGLAVGTAQVMDALRALAVIDVTRKDDFRACLRAVFIHRKEDIELFEQAFRLYFRDPFGVHATLALLLPHSNLPSEERRPSTQRRVNEALHPRPLEPPPPDPKESERIDIEASLVWSDREVLRTRDFAEMSAEELQRARAAIARMRLHREQFPVRRTRAALRGERVDVRATLRAGLRGGGHDIPLRYRVRRTEVPPLVLLCDISGSMGRYAEMVLRFVHVLVSERHRSHVFLFGTRLHNVTRALKHRDIDIALRQCGQDVGDWGGGTRIGSCLREFNRTWSRRVLGQGAIVLLITDGLDRDDQTDLGREAERLAKSCRRLVWLNPLLSFEGFQPRARGVRAILPHVDEFRPVHNLQSLEQLAAALG